MAKRVWQNHAFWENYQKDRITGILNIKHDNGKVTDQQMSVSKFTDDGVENSDFKEIVEQIGIERLDKNTSRRAENKTAEAKKKHLKQQHEKKQKLLAQLFDAKLSAFEIEEIKNSKNRPLKTRLRKSKNVFELQLYAGMIIKESLDLLE
jgi:hypothetical protein